MRRNNLAGLIFLILMIGAVTTPAAFAHKVNIFAYVEGDTVYTESYFPDGKKVKGGLIEVYDSQEQKLLEGRTDKDGQFSFKPPGRDDLKIVLIASMGHKNSYSLSADELPQTMGAQNLPEIKPQESETKATAQVDLERLRRIIDNSLDEKLRPIMRQLTKTRQKEVSFTQVASGIGYVFGLMGIIFYFLGKKKKN